MKRHVQPPAHAVPEKLRIHSRLSAQNDALADRQADAAANQVVRELDNRSGSQLAGINDGVCEYIEHRLHLFITFGRSGGQNLHASVGDTIFADDKRRVHHLRAARVKFRGNTSDKIRIAAGKIYIDATGVNTVKKAVNSQRYFLDFRRARQRGDGYTAMPRDFRGRLRALATFANQLLNGRGSDIVNHQRMAALENVFGNSSADGTEPDKTDPFHLSAQYNLRTYLADALACLMNGWSNRQTGHPCCDRSIGVPSGSCTRYSASRFAGLFWISVDAPNSLQTGLSSSMFSTSKPK